MLAGGVLGFLAHWLYLSKCHCCSSARQAYTVCMFKLKGGGGALPKGACLFKGDANVPGKH